MYTRDQYVDKIMYCVIQSMSMTIINDYYVHVLMALLPSQDGVTALMIASQYGHLIVVRILLHDI